ncbi:MAG TPA: ABC transporter ATP-binding protein [Micromonosporaceae bacterium]|nr:ABC transporter ATP-binding protein [Micromonosporaceae bacterium]
MTLRSHIVVDRGTFRLDVPLDVAEGEVVALLGPNGAGKSTALRALAGLVPLSDGTIDLAGTQLSRPGHAAPPERRQVAMVFQDYLLFPHLSALENVAFGPRSTGTPRAEARVLAAGWLDRMGLADVAGRKPGRLSGGQAQRVALARALVTRPQLLLLDEPLSALDARTRLEVRADLRRHLRDFPGATVMVTHDPLDAMALADRIVVIERGTVVQTGSPDEIVRRPRTDYVARLAGLNLYRGSAAGGTVAVDGGGTLTLDEAMDGQVFVAFPPSAVSVHRQHPEGSPRNVWEVTVVGVERYGDRVRVEFAGEPGVAAEITAVAATELDLLPGRAAWVSVKATETHGYPA